MFIKKEEALFTLVYFQVCLSRQINLHPFFYAHMNLKKEEEPEIIDTTSKLNRDAEQRQAAKDLY